MVSAAHMDWQRTYQAVELTDAGPLLRVQRLPQHLPEPAVLVQPHLIGVCRSDLKEVQGARTVRHDFGHEFVAEVVMVSGDVRFEPGQLVCLDPHIEVMRTSGFAEFVLATGRVDQLDQAFVDLPASVPLRRLVFCEPLACACHCINMIVQRLGTDAWHSLRIAVVGAGMFGAMLALLSRNHGAEIRLCNRSSERLAFLAATGLFVAHELMPLSVIDQEHDIVIVATDFLHTDVLHQAWRLVTDGGHIVLFGGTRAGDRYPSEGGVDIDRIRRTEALVPITHEHKAVRLVGCHGALPQDFVTAIDLLQRPADTFALERLIAHEINLAQAADVIAALARGDGDLIGKTIISL